MTAPTGGDVTVLLGVRLAGQDPARAHDIAITASAITSISPREHCPPPGKARLVDAQGLTATPGLIDGHSHWIWGAGQRDCLDLSGAKTLDALRALLAGRRRKLGPGEWLLAHSAQYTPFTQHGGPHRTLTDQAAGDGPCYVSFFDRHGGLANSRAIESTGLANAPAPTSGRLGTDHDGLTGFLVEFEAMSLIERHAPRPSPQQLTVLARRTFKTMNGLGYTGLQMMNGSTARTRTGPSIGRCRSAAIADRELLGRHPRSWTPRTPTRP